MAEKTPPRGQSSLPPAAMAAMVRVSISWPAAASTIKEKWRKKSMPKIGNCTSANKKIHLYCFLLKERVSSFSPQHLMGLPAGP
jgi:hypothetical protein